MIILSDDSFSIFSMGRGDGLDNDYDFLDDYGTGVGLDNDYDDWGLEGNGRGNGSPHVIVGDNGSFHPKHFLAGTV